VLARTGYDGMSIDVVAGEAQVSKGLVYRRWPTKEQLALAAITSLGDPLEPDGLPDTGQLRGDLFALVDSRWLGGTERRIATLAGLGSVLTSSPTLADAIHHQIAEPYVAAYRALLSRAVQRGEIPPGTDVDILAETIPALSTHRLMVQNGPLDRAFYESVIDHVVLAAVGLPSAP
jgi:AcrR family transcriptional regulator